MASRQFLILSPSHMLLNVSKLTGFQNLKIHWYSSQQSKTSQTPCSSLCISFLCVGAEAPSHNHTHTHTHPVQVCVFPLCRCRSTKPQTHTHTYISRDNMHLRSMDSCCRPPKGFTQTDSRCWVTLDRVSRSSCWLLAFKCPATCLCISTTDWLKLLHLLPHCRKSSRSNLPSNLITVYWHQASQT